MKKLRVFYEGWGERWPLATLADDGRHLLWSGALWRTSTASSFQLMNASDHHRKVSVSVLLSQQVNLTQPVNVDLDAAQVSRVTVTVRMPNV